MMCFLCRQHVSNCSDVTWHRLQPLARRLQWRGACAFSLVVLHAVTMLVAEWAALRLWQFHLTWLAGEYALCQILLTFWTWNVLDMQRVCCNSTSLSSDTQPCKTHLHFAVCTRWQHEHSEHSKPRSYTSWLPRRFVSTHSATKQHDQRLLWRAPQRAREAGVDTDDGPPSRDARTGSRCRTDLEGVTFVPPCLESATMRELMLTCILSRVEFSHVYACATSFAPLATGHGSCAFRLGSIS
jgi:hypothetical protein